MTIAGVTAEATAEALAERVSTVVNLRVVRKSADLSNANDILADIDRILRQMEDRGMFTQEGAQVINREVRLLLGALGVHMTLEAASRRERIVLARVGKAAAWSIGGLVVGAAAIVSGLADFEEAQSQVEGFTEQIEEGIEQLIGYTPVDDNGEG